MDPKPASPRLMLQSVSIPEGPDKLRQLLADPQQRKEFLARRLQRQQEQNPAIGRVLGLDVETTDKLLALLVDQQLANELRESPYQRGVPVTTEEVLRQDATIYDQQMREIAKLIGTARLDDYVDYERTRAARLKVEQFNRYSLSAASKLSDGQQDAFAAVLAEQEPSERNTMGLYMEVLPRLLLHLAATGISAQDNVRPSREIDVLVREQMVKGMEADNRALLERLAQVLTPEQLRAYAQQQSQMLDSQRDQAQWSRSQAGIGPNEILDPLPQPAKLTASIRLELWLRVNDSEIRKTVTSIRGNPVTFEGPQGLIMQAQPLFTILHPNRPSVELEVFESVGSKRRLLTESTVVALLTKPEPQPTEADYVEQSTFHDSRLLPGRKAYLLDWHVTATPL